MCRNDTRIPSFEENYTAHLISALVVCRMLLDARWLSCRELLLAQKWLNAAAIGQRPDKYHCSSCPLGVSRCSVVSYVQARQLWPQAAETDQAHKHKHTLGQGDKYLVTKK